MMKVKMDKAAAVAVPGVEWKKLLKPHPNVDKKVFLKEVRRLIGCLWALCNAYSRPSLSSLLISSVLRITGRDQEQTQGLPCRKDS